MKTKFILLKIMGKLSLKTFGLRLRRICMFLLFAEKSGFYKFNLSRNPFKIKINQFNKEKKAEIVTNIRGTIIKMTGIKKLVFYFGLALSSLLVLVRIHIQAFFLWIKKFKIFPHGDSGYAD